MISTSSKGQTFRKVSLWTERLAELIREPRVPEETQATRASFLLSYGKKPGTQGWAPPNSQLHLLLSNAQGLCARTAESAVLTDCIRLRIRWSGVLLLGFCCCCCGVFLIMKKLWRNKKDWINMPGMLKKHSPSHRFPNQQSYRDKVSPFGEHHCICPYRLLNSLE